MAKAEIQVNNQKIKLLKIMEILQQETDEEHPLKTSDICARLLEMHITCDTRTLGKDMRFLNDQGYEILYRMAGHEKAYYLEDRSFSLPELKILMDSVQAASCITEKKTGELTEKIAALGGSHRAELLTGNLVRFNTNKHSNEAIYYIIDTLEQAIIRRKKISFYYFRLNENGERVYRRDKYRYVQEPVALIYLEDNYYALCYSAKWKNLGSFRVDRMAEVEVEKVSITAAAKKIIEKQDFSKYTEETFKMFSGESKPVRLRFTENLIDMMFDRFGEDTKMQRTEDGLIEALVKVQVSPMFFGWICQFANQMQIIWPDSVIDEFNEYIKGVNKVVK